MSGEYGGGEFGLPPEPDDIESQTGDNFDRPESGEASPEMQKASEDFTQNMRIIFQAREKAAATMFTRGDVSSLGTRSEQIDAAYSRCEDIEARIIEQSMYDATTRGDVGYEEMNWEFVKTQETQMYFLSDPQELIRDEHYLIDGKAFIRSFIYSVEDGWIFQDIEIEDEKVDDQIIDLADSDKGADQSLDQQGAQPLEISEDLKLLEQEVLGDLGSRPVMLDAARTLASLSGRLRGEIIKEYQKQGLLESTNN